MASNVGLARNLHYRLAWAREVGGVAAPPSLHRVSHSLSSEPTAILAALNLCYLNMLQPGSVYPLIAFTWARSNIPLSQP